jgi:vancomycin resistance protein YoaR
MVAAVPVLAVLLVVAGWGVDQAASSGQALRNIDIAGRAVGGLDEATVRATVARLADEQDRWPVTIRSGEAAYESTAADLGITVDRDATVAAVLDAGRDGSQALRPFRWAGSFVHSHEVQVRYSADLLRTAMTLEAVQGADRTAPVEPTMQLSDNGFVLAPGQPGRGLAPGRVAAQLLDAMASRSDDLPDSASDEPLVLDGEPVALPTTYDDADVQLLADQANAMTAAGLTITAGPAQVTVPAGQLRPWIRLATSGDQLQLAIDSEAALAALPEAVGSVGETAVNATVTLDGTGAPVVVPSRNGVACCQDDSATRIWDALQNGQSEVELDIREMEPEWTTEEVQAWGITQPVGGNRGWQSGHEIEGPAPGFTTYHDCCASRVTNIHRLADLVRGAVIPPGGDFSINDYVGPRTADDGFVLAGAIADGRHVEEIGGGVSQFATTTFNAAYFAGLDIVSYQAHSEYFSRYPRGREATMGYPLPDLAIHNNTPYGILIWTSYTGTSLTVTLYSTPYATAEQTGISESSYGACRNVSTTRTRTFPDGTTTTDTFRATYRPGEGRTC